MPSCNKTEQSKTSNLKYTIKEMVFKTLNHWVPWLNCVWDMGSISHTKSYFQFKLDDFFFYFAVHISVPRHQMVTHFPHITTYHVPCTKVCNNHWITIWTRTSWDVHRICIAMANCCWYGPPNTWSSAWKLARLTSPLGTLSDPGTRTFLRNLGAS